VVVAQDQSVQAVEIPAAVVGAQVGPVEVEYERGHERRIGAAGRGRGRRRIELVLGAEEHGGPPVAGIAAVQAELVVPIGERKLIGGQTENEAGIPIACGRGCGHAETRDGFAHESPGLGQVGIEIDELFIGACTTGSPVDDTAGVSAINHRRATGIELNLVDELGMDHAGSDQQVVKQRDARAIEQVAGRAGTGATDHRIGKEGNDGSCARQGLNHAEGIAEGARNLLNLGTAQSDARNLLAPLVTDDDDLIRVVALALDVVGHGQLLPRHEVFLLKESVAIRSVHSHARLARRHGQTEAALGVGFDRVVAFANQRDHRGIGHWQPRAHLDKPATQRRHQRRAFLGRRRWRGWGLEGMREGDFDRHRLATIARGLELEGLRRDHHGVIEDRQRVGQQLDFVDGPVHTDEHLYAHDDGLLVGRSIRGIGNRGGAQRLRRFKRRHCDCVRKGIGWCTRYGFTVHRRSRIGHLRARRPRQQQRTTCERQSATRC
jgi:hypothetical protein